MKNLNKCTFVYVKVFCTRWLLVDVSFVYSVQKCLQYTPIRIYRYIYVLIHVFDNVDICLIAVMDGSLPKSLRHIISNAEYFGPSLFLLGKSQTPFDSCYCIVYLCPCFYGMLGRFQCYNNVKWFASLGHDQLGLVSWN